MRMPVMNIRLMRMVVNQFFMLMGGMTVFPGCREGRFNTHVLMKMVQVIMVMPVFMKCRRMTMRM